MKVLHVYKNYFPTVGGIEGHIRLLARGLATVQGVDVEVLVANTGRRTVADTVDGIPVTRASQLLFAASTPVSVSLFRELARHPADIVHLHFPYPIGELAYLVAGASRPMVLTYHSDVVRQKRLLQFYEPLLWRLLRRADRILVSNPTYAPSSPYLRHFLGKCEVVPFGVDLDRFAPHSETLARARAIKESHGGPLILFVGKLRYYKGVEYLIGAMRGLPARLLIVGSGPVEGELRAAVARHGLASQVDLLGEASDEDLPAYYHASDVFVLPSTERAESFGIVQMEAMASGLPVICTELGTGTTYVNRHGETGLVVPPRDTSALSSAIRRLLDDHELRARLGRQAQERVQQEFSPEAMVARTLKLYRDVLSGSTSAG